MAILLLWYHANLLLFNVCKSIMLFLTIINAMASSHGPKIKRTRCPSQPPARRLTSYVQNHSLSSLQRIASTTNCIMALHYYSIRNNCRIHILLMVLFYSYIVYSLKWDQERDLFVAHAPKVHSACSSSCCCCFSRICKATNNGCRYMLAGILQRDWAASTQFTLIEAISSCLYRYSMRDCVATLHACAPFWLQIKYHTFCHSCFIDMFPWSFPFSTRVPSFLFCVVFLPILAFVVSLDKCYKKLSRGHGKRILIRRSTIANTAATTS